MKKSIYYIIIALLGLVINTSCVKHTPKPKGYFRIDLKEKEYSRSDSTLPYSFEYPKNLSLIVPNKQDKEWFDINLTKKYSTEKIRTCEKDVKGAT